MGIEDDEISSAGYGYQQQQNYTTHQPSHTTAQQKYHMAQQNGYDEDGYYATNDDNSYSYASNDRRYVSHAGLNQTMPSTYHQQQQHQHQMNNHRVVKPVAVYAQRPSGWDWGSTNSRQYFGNRAPRYSDSGYVHQNSSGGYQSEWMYN